MFVFLQLPPCPVTPVKTHPPPPVPPGALIVEPEIVMEELLPFAPFVALPKVPVPFVPPPPTVRLKEAPLVTLYSPVAIPPPPPPPPK